METEYHIVESAKITIVFVHGIIGSPYRFKDFYPLVPKDISYISVVLDGHGKKASDFSHTSLKKWKEQIHSLLVSLKEKNQKVIYVGHSMGCLLGILESVNDKSLINSLFLLNVPLRPKLGFMTIKQCLKCAFGNSEKYDEITHCFKDNCCIETSKNPFVYIGWIPRFLDLFKLMKETRKVICEISAPCICFHSGKDELVQQRSLKYLKKNSNLEIHVQKDAGHYYLNQKDTKEVIERFVSLINDVCQN